MHDFEKLLLQYEKLIFHITRRYFARAEDAADAAQEAVVRIYKGFSGASFADEGARKAWICRVTANTCLSELRKKRVPSVPLDDVDAGALGPVGGPMGDAVADTVLGRERVRELLAAIQKLPDDQRMVIILRDMQGLDYAAIAEALSLNAGTVKSRISRARAALRNLLAE